MLCTVTYLKSPQKVRQVDNVLIDAGSRIEAGSQIQAGGFKVTCSNRSRGLLFEVLRYTASENVSSADSSD